MKHLPGRRMTAILQTGISLLCLAAFASCSPAEETSLPESATQAESDGSIDLSSLTDHIAFSAGPPHGEDIYVINADGSGLAQVTTDSAADFDPSWSPDGQWIAYRHQPGDDESTEIFTIGADGSDPQNLTNNEGVADWGPAWSPDGSKIAFDSSGDHRGTLRGYLMNTDGSDNTQIDEEAWIEYPAWSPDGTRLAFMAQTPEGTNNYEIWVINVDGSGLTRLTDSPGADGWPSWSPDGTQIAFSSVRDDCQYSDAADCKSTGDIGPFHTLYVMNADGSEPTRITDVYVQFMDWSPDGQYIVLDGDGGPRVIRTDGTGLSTIPTGLGYCAFPDWNP